MTLIRRIPIENAYWLLALDESGGRHVIVDQTSFEEWTKVDSKQASMWLFRGSKMVHAIDFMSRGDLFDLMDAIGGIESPEHHHHGMTLRTAYTAGDCDVLALALSLITGHGLIAVTKSTDDEGRPIRKHQLIHAAVRFGPYIFDIDGESDQDDWETNWCQNAGGGWDEAHCVPITRRRMESLQECKFTKDAIHTAANLAWLIAGLTDQLSPDEAAVLAAQHEKNNNAGTATA